ncbi:MAG TPA: mechanosensitive ion channel domain-containing protein, partial [Woeseiaceae bacterium]|nr:mechanosensitive ion channel domain-containing protein [Woeseiaceae bacterium]
MDIEELKARALEYWDVAVGYMSQPELLFQVGLIVVLFVPAWFLSKRVEPLLEKQARKIKGMPGTLRLIVAFLRRMEWLFVVLLLGIAYLATTIAPWPEKNYLIYSAMLLAGAWLLISVVSHAIRKRVVRRLFSLIVWVFVAASILGIVDDVAAILDGIGFSVGEIRFSVLNAIKAVFFIGVLMWAALKTGNFIDNRIQQVDELTPSLRVLLGKILRIALIVFAVMIAMQSLNLDLTALTVLSGAVGVGIGFGLQKVVSNFISGMIILLDQSIKPGDTITVGETFGWIRELR